MAVRIRGRKPGLTPSGAKRILLFGAGALILLASSSLIIELAYGTNHSTLIFKGYYTVLAEKQPGAPVDWISISRVLGRAEIISEATARVEITSINGFERIALKDLERRLDPLDPRFDDYLKNITGYFHTDEDFEAAFIKADRHPLVLYLELASYFSKKNIEFTIADWHPLEKLGFALIAILFCFPVILTLANGRMRLAGFICALPWLFCIIRAGTEELCLFIATLPFFAVFISGIEPLPAPLVRPGTEQIRSGEKLTRDFILLAFIVIAECSLLTLAGRGESLSGPLIALATGLFTVILYFTCVRFETSGKSVKSVSKRRVSIKKEQAKAYRKKLLFLFVSMSSLVLICVYVLVQPFAFDGEIAYPSRNPGEAFRSEAPSPYSAQALRNLFSSKDERSLPNLSDYIAHKAFQEGFVFGGKYSFPLGSSIELPHFLRTGQRITETQNTVSSFNEAWLRQTLKEAENGGLEKLLVSQENPVRISLGNAKNRERARIHVWILLIFCASVNLIVFFLPGHKK